MTLLNAYDVVIHATELRYWVLLLGSLSLGLLLIRWFDRLEGEALHRAVRRMGGTLLAVQVLYQLYMAVHPDFHYSLHRSLPLHFCGINIWLVSLNCFWRHRMVYTFTAFLGTIGGFHALLTPKLTVGDAFPILLHFYFNHMALIVVPVVMTKALGMRFPKWGWVKAYLIAALVSTLMVGVNGALNAWVPGEAVANYMYMTEAPIADNPFVFREWPWPWYILPLHGALLLHLVVLNALYRWRAPMEGPEGRLPLWQ